MIDEALIAKLRAGPGMAVFAKFQIAEAINALHRPEGTVVNIQR